MPLQQPAIHYALGTLTITDWPPVAVATGPKDVLLALHHQQVHLYKQTKAACNVKHALQGYLHTIWVHVLAAFTYKVSFFGLRLSHMGSAVPLTISSLCQQLFLLPYVCVHATPLTVS